jgi:hypothetical protein
VFFLTLKAHFLSPSLAALRIGLGVVLDFKTLKRSKLQDAATWREMFFKITVTLTLL